MFDNKNEKHLGCTGTQRGMDRMQHQDMRDLLLYLYGQGFRFFHHGDCIGADAEMHALALEIGYKVIIHPPSDSSKRAFCAGAFKVLPPKPYLDRNHDIVDQSDEMVAAPGERFEKLRSGTWATIRYVRKVSKPLRIVLPLPA